MLSGIQGTFPDNFLVASGVLICQFYQLSLVETEMSAPQGPS